MPSHRLHYCSMDHRHQLHFSPSYLPRRLFTLDHHTCQNKNILTLPTRETSSPPRRFIPTSCFPRGKLQPKLESANQGRSFSDDCTTSLLTRLCLLIFHFFSSPTLRSVLPSTVTDHGGVLSTPPQLAHPSRLDERPSLRHQRRWRRGRTGGSRHLQDMPRGGQ